MFNNVRKPFIIAHTNAVSHRAAGGILSVASQCVSTKSAPRLTRSLHDSCVLSWVQRGVELDFLSISTSTPVRTSHYIVSRGGWYLYVYYLVNSHLCVDTRPKEFLFDGA